MAFIIDGQEALYNGEDYKFIKKHRASGNPNASVWICSFKEEFDLAENGLKSQYTERKNETAEYTVRFSRCTLIFFGNTCQKSLAFG